MNEIENDLADFSRRTNAKWPDSIKAWEARETRSETTRFQSRGEEETKVVRAIVLKSPNSNAQGVG